MSTHLLRRSLLIGLLCCFSTACSLLKPHDPEFVETSRGSVATIGEVYFEFDKATLLPIAERKMDKIAEAVQTLSTRKVLISGHTDSQGDVTYNQGLSERRANTVLNALVKRGVNMSRLKARGFGQQQPIASNATPEGRQQNRRVEVLILNEGLDFND